MTAMTRAERTHLRLGGLASELLPLVCKNPAKAYAYALHKQIEALYGTQHASVSDVSRTLQEMATLGILATEPKGPDDRQEAKVVYKPTFLGGFYVGIILPRNEWGSAGLAPKPEIVRKAS